MTTSPTTIESVYVVDTHALIWYLTNNKNLSKRVVSIFEAAERGETRIHVSAVAIAEMYFADKKWQLFDDFAKMYAELKAKPFIRFVPLVADEILDFTQDAVIPEMHDRIIVGLARRLNAPLITSDGPVTAANHVKTVW